MFNSKSMWFDVFQARGVGKPSIAGALPDYDECVPMVDKAVDVGWEKRSHQNPTVSGG